MWERPWNLYFAVLIISIIVLLTFLYVGANLFGLLISVTTGNLGVILAMLISSAIGVFTFMAYMKMWHLTVDCVHDEKCKWREKSF